MVGSLMPIAASPPPIRSDEEYARLLGSLRFWEPYARAAVDRAGLPPPSRLEMHTIGTYPAVVADTGVVVKLFGDRWSGPESHRAERAALGVLAGSDLPVPDLVAEGELYPGGDWPWPYLITQAMEGRPYRKVEPLLDPAQRHGVARSMGELLRRLHEVPLPKGETHLGPSWDRFLALLERRRREAPADHIRWRHLPAQLVSQLEGFLPDPGDLVDTSGDPVLVHGDLHADHVFLDPHSGEVTGLIDFTDAHAGDPRYDLVALHTGTFRLRRDMLGSFLESYGWDVPKAGWAEEMLAFTILHDFDVLEGIPPETLQGVGDLPGLAARLWKPLGPSHLDE